VPAGMARIFTRTPRRRKPRRPRVVGLAHLESSTRSVVTTFAPMFYSPPRCRHTAPSGSGTKHAPRGITSNGPWKHRATRQQRNLLDRVVGVSDRGSRCSTSGSEDCPGHRPDGGNVTPADAGHVVFASGFGRNEVIELPPEDPRVERGAACGSAVGCRPNTALRGCSGCVRAWSSSWSAVVMG